VLPEFIEAGAFPAAAGLGLARRLGDEVGEVGADEGGDGFAMADKTKTNLQFIGDELEIGGVLQRHKVLEKLADLWGPGWPVVPAGELGAELGAVLEPEGSESVQVGTADLELFGGFKGVNRALVERVEDLQQERSGEAFGQLFFFTVQNEPELPLGRGSSSASATLQPPQPLDQGAGKHLSPFELAPVSFCSRPDI